MSPGGRPLKFKTVEILQEKIEAYFASCFEEQWEDVPTRTESGGLILDDKGKRIYTPVKKIVNIKPVTITGLAVALGCDRETLLNYEKKEEFFGTIKAAKTKIHEYVESCLFKGNAAGIIFNLKNNFNWKDKTEVETSDKGLNEILNEIDRRNKEEAAQ